MKEEEFYIFTVPSLLSIFFIFIILFLIVGCTEDHPSSPATLPNWKTLSFSGYIWRVKTSETLVGPGPNYFSDSSENVWVDELGQLHLRITQEGGPWYCPEVVTEKSFGYGTYRFYVASGVDQLNEHVVLGLFTWDDDPAYYHREIDIEISRWGQVTNENAQFVVQPYYNDGNMRRFTVQLNGSDLFCSFEWRRESIFFQSGYGYNDSTFSENGFIIESWQYTGQDIPPPGHENARINVWLFNGVPPSDGQEVEVVIRKFEFIPYTE